MFLVLSLLLSMFTECSWKSMVLSLLRLCVFYYCVQVLQPIEYNCLTFRKYARVLTSDSGELPKLSTKSFCHWLL